MVFPIPFRQLLMTRQFLRRLQKSCVEWGIQGPEKRGNRSICHSITIFKKRYKETIDIGTYPFLDNVMPETFLHPKPPYDFSLSAAIFSKGDPSIRIFKQGIFRQALEAEGIPVLVEVASEGSVDSPRLRVSTIPEDTLTKSGFEKVKRIISSIFAINDDLQPFYEAMEQDSIMTALVHQLRGV